MSKVDKNRFDAEKLDKIYSAIMASFMMKIEYQLIAEIFPTAESILKRYKYLTDLNSLKIIKPLMIDEAFIDERVIKVILNTGLNYFEVYEYFRDFEFEEDYINRIRNILMYRLEKKFNEQIHEN